MLGISSGNCSVKSIICPNFTSREDEAKSTIIVMGHDFLKKKLFKEHPTKIIIQNEVIFFPHPNFMLGQVIFMPNSELGKG